MKATSTHTATLVAALLLLSCFALWGLAGGADTRERA